MDIRLINRKVMHGDKCVGSRRVPMFWTKGRNAWLWSRIDLGNSVFTSLQIAIGAAVRNLDTWEIKA